MPRPATLEELLLRQLRDFAECSGLADVVPVEATLASAELLQMGVEQAEETKLKLQVVAMLGGGLQAVCFVTTRVSGSHAPLSKLKLQVVAMLGIGPVTVSCVDRRVLGSHSPLCFALQGSMAAQHCPARRLHASSTRRLLTSSATGWHVVLWFCSQGVRV